MAKREYKMKDFRNKLVFNLFGLVIFWTMDVFIAGMGIYFLIGDIERAGILGLIAGTAFWGLRERRRFMIEGRTFSNIWFFWSTRIDIGIERADEHGDDIRKWLDQHTTKRYIIDDRGGYAFRSGEEAAHFKLRWYNV